MRGKTEREIRLVQKQAGFLGEVFESYENIRTPELEFA